MLARELIIESYYLSGIVGRRFETVDGTQVADGLTLLNNLLSEKSINGRDLPYYDHINVPIVVGQGVYEIENVVRVEDVTFNINTVRYSVIEVSRDEFWSTSRAENVNALPYIYYLERALGGMKLYVYFSPSVQLDFFTVTGQIGFPVLTFGSDLDLIIGTFYQSYLKYKLARRICDFNQVSFPPFAQQELTKLQNQIDELNPIDYSSKILNQFSKDQAIDYPQINLSPDWTPS